MGCRQCRGNRRQTPDMEPPASDDSDSAALPRRETTLSVIIDTLQALTCRTGVEFHEVRQEVREVWEEVHALRGECAAMYKDLGLQEVKQEVQEVKDEFHAQREEYAVMHKLGLQEVKREVREVKEEFHAVRSEYAAMHKELGLQEVKEEVQEVEKEFQALHEENAAMHTELGGLRCEVSGLRQKNQDLVERIDRRITKRDTALGSFAFSKQKMDFLFFPK